MLTLYGISVLYLVVGVSAAFALFPGERQPGDEDPFQEVHGAHLGLALRPRAGPEVQKEGPA
jgi:hypothetical protein